MHQGNEVIFDEYPVDPDSTEVYYFVLGGLFREDGSQAYPPALADGEAVTQVSAIVDNGDLIAGPAYYDELDQPRYRYTGRIVYSIMAKPTIASFTGQMRVTLRYSTTLGRENIDRTAVIPVIEQ